MISFEYTNKWTKIFILITALLVAITSTSFAQSLSVKMLNVGQGDAILIQSDEQTILIDTSDVDERNKLMKELYKAKVKKIDKLILTHSHADHIGGAKPLIESYPIGEIYTDGTDRGNYTIYKGYQNAAKKRGIPIKTLTAGDVLSFGDDIHFLVFYPFDWLRIRYAAEKKYNNTSIVGKLTFKNFSMMFTGDAEAEAEVEQLNTYEWNKFKSVVLKAPHHGSNTSSSEEYVKAVNPQYVFISAGTPGIEHGNVFGHPHKKTLDTYLKSGINPENIYCTYKNGTITLETDGLNFRVSSELHNG